MTFPYPGDDPSTLVDVMSDISVSQGKVERLSSELGSAKGDLASAWTGDAADKAQSDMQTLTTVLPGLAKRLGDASNAVSAYQSVAFQVRYDVDDIRSRYAKLSTLLSGEQTDYGRAGRMGEINDMTPKQVAEYRGEIAKSEKITQGKMTDLEAEYKRQVTKNNHAAEACQKALTASFTVTHYAGSTLTADSLVNGLGLGGFQVAHMVKMEQDAKAFEKAMKHINDTSLPASERTAQIKALIAKYGNDASDPIFATTVTTDEGQGYFLHLEQQMARYEHNPYGPGGVDPDLEKALFKLNATILGTATDTSNPVHVSQQWINDFFGDGHGNLAPENIMAGADLLKSGAHFSKSFLDTMGSDVIKWENEPHTNRDANGHLQQPWSFYQQDRWTPDGQPDWNNSAQDPLAEVMRQYADHPDNTSVLFQDPTSPPGAYQAGDLYFLTHRKDWSGDGASVFGTALANETGPAAGDLHTSAAIASAVFRDVGGNPDGVDNGMHKGIATIAGRYMGDIINAESDTGHLPHLGTLQASGLGDGLAGHASMTPDEIKAMLHIAYSDPHDADSKTILAKAWATSSHQLTANAISDTQRLYADPSADHNLVQIDNVTNASATTLGLLTGSDVKAFDDDSAAAAEKAAYRHQILETLGSFIPTPEIPGAGALTSTAIDGATELLKGGATDWLAPDGDPNAAAVHAGQTYDSASGKVTSTTESYITALSHAGLPVIATHHADGTVSGLQDTVAPDAKDGLDHTLFTSPDGRLKPLSTIDATPGAKTAFDTWLGEHGYGPGGSSLGDKVSVVSNHFGDGYNQGNPPK